MSGATAALVPGRSHATQLVHRDCDPVLSPVAGDMSRLVSAARSLLCVVVVKLVLAIVLVGCTVGAARPSARDVVPPDVLDHEDPSVDVSNNPVITRSVAHYRSRLGVTHDHGGPGAAAEAIGYALAIGAVSAARR